MKNYSSDFVKILVWNFLAVVILGGCLLYMDGVAVGKTVELSSIQIPDTVSGWEMARFMLFLAVFILGVFFSFQAATVWSILSDDSYHDKLFYWDMVLFIGMWSLLFCILGWTGLMINGSLASLVGVWLFIALIYRIMIRFG